MRLTVPDGPLSIWRRPEWLLPGNLTYHRRPERWSPDGLLKAAPRGQEFVTDIADVPAAHAWLDTIIAEINRS